MNAGPEKPKNKTPKTAFHKAADIVSLVTLVGGFVCAFTKQNPWLTSGIFFVAYIANNVSGQLLERRRQTESNAELVFDVLNVVQELQKILKTLSPIVEPRNLQTFTQQTSQLDSIVERMKRMGLTLITNNDDPKPKL